jgi:site-specific DNA-methyltransferase (adenine-specific)
MLIERILGEERRAPDILDCLSNLSSDEVFTPPLLAGRMLDLLPDDVWTNPDLKWLDPACKTGVFLRGAASRLMVGLAGVIEDEDERRRHIFESMLYGIAITELTGHISRRSLYYSKDASGEYAVVKLRNSQGNIVQRRSEHSYDVGTPVSRPKCKICGTPDDLDSPGREGMENYAYTFIHEELEEVFDMKFDVIIGNPPYQLETEGYGAQATPIYQYFIEKALDLSPRYASFILPARWFAGGMGVLNDFRERMINDRRVKELVDYPRLFEAFPGVEIKGGVCYFLWDRDHDGDCRVTTMVDGQPVSEAIRDLREGGGVLIRSNEGVSILEKVRAKGEETLESSVSAINPFNLATNFDAYQERPSETSVDLYLRGGKKWLPKSKITKNRDLVHRHKVLTPKAGDGHGRVPMKVTGVPIVAPPPSVCTMTYIVAGVFDSAIEAENFAAYLATKFVRHLVSLRKTAQNVSAGVFSFVPKLDMKHRWSDEELYERYELAEAEIEFVESQLLEMTP